MLRQKLSRFWACVCLYHPKCIICICVIISYIWITLIAITIQYKIHNGYSSFWLVWNSVWVWNKCQHFKLWKNVWDKSRRQMFGTCAWLLSQVWLVSWGLHKRKEHSDKLLRSKETARHNIQKNWGKTLTVKNRESAS